MKLFYILGCAMIGGIKVKTKALCFICTFLFVLSGCADSTKHNSSINPLAELSIKQKYDMLEDDENWYYFDDGIYKINKKDGASVLVYQEKILRTNHLSNSWIYDDYIYYVNVDWYICRVKTSGQDHSVILDVKQFWEYDEQPVHGIIVIDNKLFVQMSFELYCYDMKIATTVAHDARQIGVLGKDIYFCGRDATINKMNVIDKEPQVILQSNMNGDDKREWKNLYKDFIFVDGIMYYYMRNPDGLYRYQNDKSRLVSDDANINEFSLFEHDGELYFITRCDEADKLMRYDPEDEKITEVLVCSDFVRGPKIIDGYFYYLNSEYEIEQLKLNA